MCPYWTPNWAIVKGVWEDLRAGRKRWNIEMGEIDEIGWRGEQRSSTVASWEILESQRTEMCEKKERENKGEKK